MNSVWFCRSGKTPSVFGFAESTFPARAGKERRGPFCIAVLGTFCGCAREERRCGFALGLGVRGGGGFVFEEVVCADERECLGLGFDDRGAGGVDALGCVLCAAELVGLEEVGEFGKGEVVEFAEIEGGDGGVEEVF